MILQYIDGVNISKDKKEILIKRKSNQKWYEADILLRQIKNTFDSMDYLKLKIQFQNESKEIFTLLKLFGIYPNKSLICKIKRKNNFDIK